MPITDLTGYTWVGNSIITYQGDYSFTVNFKDLNNNTYSSISIGDFGGDNDIEYDNTNVFYGESNWRETYYQTITFTGGTDVTNSNLISWLEANGTLTAPIQANTYNLTHTLTNVTKGNITLQITPDAGYTYPATLTVTNGTLVSYDNTTGVAVINGDDTTVVSGECVAQPSGYSVTFTASGSWSHSPQGSVQIYDGQDNTGILLLNQTQADKSAFPMTLQVSSGYCCVYIDGLGVMGTGSSSSQDFNIVYGNPLIIGPINKNGSVDIVVEDFDD